MMGSFPTYKPCRTCGTSFKGGPSTRECPECRERRARRRFYAQQAKLPQRAAAPSPYREAMANHDVELAQRALWGELD